MSEVRKVAMNVCEWMLVVTFAGVCGCACKQETVTSFVYSHVTPYGIRLRFAYSNGILRIEGPSIDLDDKPTTEEKFPRAAEDSDSETNYPYPPLVEHWVVEVPIERRRAIEHAMEGIDVSRVREAYHIPDEALDSGSLDYVFFTSRGRTIEIGGSFPELAPIVEAIDGTVPLAYRYWHKSQD